MPTLTRRPLARISRATRPWTAPVGTLALPAHGRSPAPAGGRRRFPIAALARAARAPHRIATVDGGC
jgi:hypothetical protein